MKIETLQISRLHTEEAFGFHLLVMPELAYLPSESSTPSESEEGSTPVLTATVTDYQTKVSALDVALKESKKMESTALKSAADKGRDDAWSGANLYTRAMVLHPDAATAAIAEEVRALFLKYGNPVDMPQTEESGVLHNLIQDLLAVDSAKLEAINFTPWLTDMQTTAEAYMEAAQASTAEEASHMVGIVKAALDEANAAYRKLVETVNAHVVLYGGAPYATFISHLNTLIANQKTILKARKTNAEKKDAETGRA